MRALNHKLRTQIIEYLRVNQKVTVTQLYIHLRLEQSVASQHLAILRRAGIAKADRDGKFIYYSINEERIAEIIKFCEDITGIKSAVDTSIIPTS